MNTKQVRRAYSNISSSAIIVLDSCCARELTLSGRRLGVVGRVTEDGGRGWGKELVWNSEKANERSEKPMKSHERSERREKANQSANKMSYRRRNTRITRDINSFNWRRSSSKELRNETRLFVKVIDRIGKPFTFRIRRRRCRSERGRRGSTTRTWCSAEQEWKIGNRLAKKLN